MQTDIIDCFFGAKITVKHKDDLYLNGDFRSMNGIKIETAKCFYFNFSFPLKII